MPLSPGARLGHYDVTSLLGEGGMGQVWQAREIGIRMAMGAQHAALKRMFVRTGLALAGVGVACGVGIAAGLSRLMTSMLFGVSPLDPTTFVVVAVTLAGVAALASYLPARRATAVDAMHVLRAD